VLPTDMLILRDRLAELAEVFERKPIGEKALKVWFDILREFPVERVAGVLIGWPKSHNKFPSPSEVWKACGEIGSSEIERKAALEAKETFHWERSPAGAQFLAKMKSIINKPSRSPMEHWRHVLETQKPGSSGYEFASEALKRKQRREETEF
jgi:hypothetical protein